MDFNNLERKTKAELFELMQSKQVEIDALNAKIDDAFLENAKLKHVIDQVKLHNGSLGFRSMQRMIEELLK